MYGFTRDFDDITGKINGAWTAGQLFGVDQMTSIGGVVSTSKTQYFKNNGTR